MNYFLAASESCPPAGSGEEREGGITLFFFFVRTVDRNSRNAPNPCGEFYRNAKLEESRKGPPSQTVETCY